MIGILRGVGSEVLALGTAILVGLLAFFTFRRKYINQGEHQANVRAMDQSLRRINKGLKNAQTVDNVSRNNVDGMLRETGAEY